MNLRKELTELLSAGVIDKATAEKINNYYDSKLGTPQNKLVIVFGILGALLTGLGIILILAHNWDELSRTTKTTIAYIPLLAGQALCAYTLFKKDSSIAWREASSAFLFIAIGTCISLISQIYNIPGSISSFMLSWMLLALPIVYIMSSSIASLMYIAGITWYACETGYFNNRDSEGYYYWGLLLLILPYYYLLYRKHRESNFFIFHNWFIPLSVIIVLGTVADEVWQLMLVAYMSLFGLLYHIGNLPLLREQKIRNNGYLVLGSLGTVVVLLGLSFDFFWSELRENPFWKNELIASPEFIASSILTLAAAIVWITHKWKQRPLDLKPVEAVFILFIIIFIIGTHSPVAVLVNLLVLMIGILTIREGAREFHFAVLNYGLLIVTALVICRFFDTEIGFVFKGILFVAVGVGFFLANMWMLRKRKEESIEMPDASDVMEN